VGTTCRARSGSSCGDSCRRTARGCRCIRSECSAALPPVFCALYFTVPVAFSIAPSLRPLARMIRVVRAISPLLFFWPRPSVLTCNY
jgi:hypothetical protein